MENQLAAHHDDFGPGARRQPRGSSVTPTPILVFGATGTQGGAVARALLAKSVPVRALVRNPSSDRAKALLNLGAELVVGDLTDEWSLAQALSAVPVAYAITTPFENGPDAEVRQ